MIVGVGVFGFCVGYELKKVGFDVMIFEVFFCVGGCVVMFCDLIFVFGLYVEGGVMCIFGNYFFL